MLWLPGCGGCRKSWRRNICSDSNLEEQQDATIESVGGSKVYNYCYAFNGFAARMTAADAEAPRSRPADS